MNKLSKKWKLVLFWTPLALIPVCVLTAPYLAILCKYLIPPCPYYTFFHIYCFGCGGTRCVLALLRFDLLTALRQNAGFVLLLFCWLLFEIQLGLDLCGKKVTLLPKKPAFWWCFGGLLLLYYILRNFIPAIAPF